MAIHPDTLIQASELIERFEGIELTAYKDAVGIPTICAGITQYPNGRSVAMGDTCTAEQCKAHLSHLLLTEYVPAMERIPGWERLGPARQSVLLSFAWNLGSGFFGSEGFETITRVLREGAEDPLAYKRMPAALNLYVKAGGQTLEGLVNRRQEEGRIWMSEEDPMLQFIALQDTWLKKAPIDSVFLSARGRIAKKKGGVIHVTRTDDIPADGHVWWTLANGERWAAFAPHWKRHNAPEVDFNPDVDWTNFDAKAGLYITVGEVLQYDARRYPKKGSTEEKNLLALCEQFDAIRRAWGAPLAITSGYRPEPINREVGGVPNSYHVRGMALDIYPADRPLDAFYTWISKRWSGGLGDGRRKGFVHLDTRSGGRFSTQPTATPAAVWDY